jgi:hypothetical protein
MAGNQIAAPSHLTFRQGVHIQMMNIHRNSKVEDILEEYHILRDEDTFTDLEVVTRDGKSRRLHSLVMAASSEFLRHWMEITLPLPMVSL